ncbi:hypothetical protein X997_5074 [Burkholderia pseudomallei A79C]|nr:hypothetical protein X997_5074 [Burkholderia pseudomallei A79C]
MTNRTTNRTTAGVRAVRENHGSRARTTSDERLFQSRMKTNAGKSALNSYLMNRARREPNRPNIRDD